MLFVIFSDISMNYVLFAKMDKDFILKKTTKHLKNTGKVDKKILEKSGNFVSPEEWEP